ncbi:RNA methyltransferase [Halieaceae bacterium IMCC14734]|uniref:RNA methyltransferase n=1 Tax=Candidatus Litorirhabdus singularis TaxID=2518993 RepID=A0ABT3TI23_9GAMM|nr:RNA methyltransferase [Candidatus Litorirhabdus singularis]MCX2981440.1 RNA methyltransferase [Candidatus Litorirhabdus singularis]
MSVPDSPEFKDRKALFDRMITVYGRNPVLEALEDPNLECFRLHLADSNKPAAVLQKMQELAVQRGAEVCFHGKRELSRISRNGKQDQGVAADIVCPGFRQLEQYLELPRQGRQRLLALDGISNPQNLGMLVRSAVAGGINGIVWSARGNAELGPLAIKASTGTLYRAPILRCENLGKGLAACQAAGFAIRVLGAEGSTSLLDAATGDTGSVVYVLGNETRGVSAEIRQLADATVSIPMASGVESLNVAVTAALIAYLDR